MKNLYKHILAVASGLISLVVYITTLNPTVTFMDSGELSAACATFGIPHPTGYPLYLVIGYVFAKLPFSSSPVYNLNLLSAVLSSAAVVMFFYCVILIIDLLKESKPAKQQKQKNVKASEAHKRSGDEIIIIAFFSALIFAFSRTFWSNADAVEVYPLHALFLVTLIYFCLKIYSGLKTDNKKSWVLLFIFLGLSFSNHLTTVFVLPAILLIYYLQYKANPVLAISIRKYMFLVIPGLLLYIILMIRASAEPFINWSNPSNISNLFHHVSGGDYSQLMFSSSSVFSKNASLFFSSVLKEFAIASGIIAVIGLVYLYFRNKNLFYFLLLLILSCLAYSLNYNIRDVLTYFLLVFITLGFSFTAGIVWLLDYLIKNLKLEKNAAVVTVTIGLVLTGISLKYNYAGNDNRNDYVIEDITLNTLNQAEPNAVLMTYDWGYVYPASIYYQQVNHLRGDLKVFNVKFLSAPWYLEMIKKYYPDIYGNCKNEIDDYLSIESNTQSSLSSAKLSALVKAFIIKNRANHPFYMTYDFAYSKEIRPMIADYLIQPAGFVYKLVSKGAPYDSTTGISSLDLNFRKYEPDSQEKEKTYIFTAGIYYDNAVYHFTHKNFPLALRFTDKAIEMRNNFNEAINLKNQILKESKPK